MRYTFRESLNLVKKILEKSITTFATEKKITLSRLQIQNEMRDRVEDILEYHDWNELEKLNDQIIEQALNIALLEERKRLADKEFELNQLIEQYKKNIALFSEQDIISQRLLLMKDYINEMLPLNKYDKTNENQTIRSRGLAIAALAGLQHVGNAKQEGDAK
jgi:hypothetical protein